MADLSQFNDFLEEADPNGSAEGQGPGFASPPMPSRAHPKAEGGRSYWIEAPDALTGLRLSAMADMTLKASRGIDLGESDVRRLRLDDKEEREFLEMVLGPALNDMLTDGVSWPHVQRLGMYAFLRYGINEDAADQAAQAGLFSGKRPAPTNRAGRRKKSKKTSSASADSKTTKRRT